MRNRRPNNTGRKKPTGHSNKSGERSFSKPSRGSNSSQSSSRKDEGHKGGQPKRKEWDGKRGKPDRKGWTSRSHRGDSDDSKTRFRKKGSGHTGGKEDKRGHASSRGKSKVGAKPRAMVASSWSAKGEAVYNTADGKRTLIWSGIPFEKAIVQITHAGQNQNFGYVKSVLEPSPYRVDPKCKRYDRCGGCPLMHLSDDGQDEAKLQLFARTM